MQAYSLIDWENAVNLGLQNGSFKGDDLEKALAAKERGEAIADLIWALPINLIAIIGIFRKEFYGFVAAMMEFAICIYFPLFYIFQIGANEKSIAEFRTQITKEKKEIKATYEKSLAELEQKNDMLKEKLNDFKDDETDNWNSFKTEFSGDMNDLGTALKNFSVKNS